MSPSILHPIALSVLMLAVANVFMTFAWYGHLRHQSGTVVTLCVFVPFAFFFLKEPLKLDYLWAGLCLVAAVYFVFRQ